LEPSSKRRSLIVPETRRVSGPNSESSVVSFVAEAPPNSRPPASLFSV
jgi:hypothetical protein